MSCVTNADETVSLYFSPRALRVLLNYSYPGNIRELENIIRHAVAMTDGDTIREIDLPSPPFQSLGSAGDQPVGERLEGLRPILGSAEGLVLSLAKDNHSFAKGSSLDQELATYEKLALKAALEKAEGVQKRAAELLGINYRSLRHRLQKYNLG